MTGETDLDTLLKSMNPVLHDGEFVFCTAPPERMETLGCEPICRFREDEGVSLIMRREDADRERLPYKTVFRMITLTVHSSLDAVGFLAAITAELAGRGISVNPVSAYFHDRLFVPSERAAEAMRALEALKRAGAQ